MNPDETLEEQIFAQALKSQSAADRAACLDAACAADPALRARVEALLQAHERAGAFLTPPVVENDPSLDEAGLSEGPGTTIGRYNKLRVV
jgi:hypothetical protein